MSYDRMDGESNDSSTNLKSALTAPPNIPLADGTVKTCNSWDDTYAYGYPDSTQTSRYISSSFSHPRCRFFFTFFRLTFWIPSNASSLWLHSLGKIPGLTSGQLSIILNPDETQTKFLISVTVTYGLKDYGAQNSTAICLLQSGQTEWGVGFYVSYSLFFSFVSCSNVLTVFFFKLLEYEPSIPSHHLYAANRR